MKRGLTLIAAVMAVMAITTTALAATGGFDWIMQRINPNFAEVIEPVMLYTEDEGIRMTVIGAQTFDNMAVIYVSLQDVSGENRLTELGSLGLGLFLNKVIEESTAADADNNQDADYGYSEVIPPPMFSAGTSVRRIYFDEATATAYFELTMTVTDAPMPNSLIINNTCVELDRIFINDEPVGISLTNLEAPNILEVTLGHDIHTSRGWNDDSLLNSTISMLEPGRFAPLPNYTDNHWVSNIGVIDGNLHVQTMGYFDGRFGGSGVSFGLLRSDGEVIYAEDMIFATADENYNLASGLAMFTESRALLNVNEFIFEVDVENLSDYTLVFFGSISYGVEGDWTIQVDTSDTSTQIITISESHYVSGHTVEFVTINPIGMQVRGSFPADWTMGSNETLTAYIETTEGLVELRQSGGFYAMTFGDVTEDGYTRSSGQVSVSESEESTGGTHSFRVEAREAPEATGGVFTLNFDAESLIDIESVTAIIINGYRIAVS
jgi:hypothetical protein